MSYDSARPDLDYIRSGGLKGYPMGCDPAARRETQRVRRRSRLTSSTEKTGEPTPKAPRFAWLPP